MSQTQWGVQSESRNQIIVEQPGITVKRKHKRNRKKKDSTLIYATIANAGCNDQQELGRNINWNSAPEAQTKQTRQEAMDIPQLGTDTNQIPVIVGSHKVRFAEKKSRIRCWIEDIQQDVNDFKCGDEDGHPIFITGPSEFPLWSDRIPVDILVGETKVITIPRTTRPNLRKPKKPARPCPLIPVYDIYGESD